jgi:ribosome recycling factor
VKVAARYAEAARVAVRNVRRDGMEQLKKLEKDGELSQDAHHKTAAQVQELTDAEIKQINDMLAAKEAEIMTI